MATMRAWLVGLACAVHVDAVRVLVVGGTGKVGRHVVAQLHAQGVPHRVLARDPASAARLLPADTDICAGDVTDEASLARAMEGGVTACISVAGISRFTTIADVLTGRLFKRVPAKAGSRDGDAIRHPYLVNELGTRNLAAAAKASGTCSKIVRVTGLSVGRPAFSPVPLLFNSLLSVSGRRVPRPRRAPPSLCARCSRPHRPRSPAAHLSRLAAHMSLTASTLRPRSRSCRLLPYRPVPRETLTLGRCFSNCADGLRRFHSASENELRTSGLDYTILRPGGLSDEPSRGGRARLLGKALRPPARIGRADLASLCIEAVTHPDASNATFGVAWAAREGPAVADAWALLLARARPSCRDTPAGQPRRVPPYRLAVCTLASALLSAAVAAVWKLLGSAGLRLGGVEPLAAGLTAAWALTLSALRAAFL
jgi:uncharacterized protein YbjT (DUF2867 family)